MIGSQIAVAQQEGEKAGFRWVVFVLHSKIFSREVPLSRVQSPERVLVGCVWVRVWCHRSSYEEKLRVVGEF